MIDKRLRSEIAQCELNDFTEWPLHFDICTTRYFKSGSKCSLVDLGELISCREDTHPAQPSASGTGSSPLLENKPFSDWRGVLFFFILFLFLKT